MIKLWPGTNRLDLGTDRDPGMYIRDHCFHYSIVGKVVDVYGMLGVWPYDKEHSVKFWN